MATVWSEVLAASAGADVYAAGERLFTAGAVLQWTREARAIEAMVANEQRRFERVTVHLGRKHVTCTCTCHTGRRLCAHAVASLLCAARDEPDWLAHAADHLVPTRQEVVVSAPRPAAPSPATGGGIAPAPAPVAPARARARLVREFLLLHADKPRLHLRFPVDLPLLESRWGHVVVQVWLEAGGRRYSAQNIARLADGLPGSGGMLWQQFSPQEQQIMRFLAGKGEWLEAGFDLGAFELAELFHLLCGFRQLAREDDSPFCIHAEPASVIIEVGPLEAGELELRPRFAVAGRGVLEPGTLRVVCGAAGYWVGLDGDFWWVPAIADVGWFRTFQRGDPERVTPAEVERLMELAAAGSVPLQVVPAAASGALAVTPGVARPVLLLDWQAHELVAELMFDYSGRRITLDGPAQIWTGEQLVGRDLAGEARALHWLESNGFRRGRGPASLWHLGTPDMIWQFWELGLERLPAGWQVFLSQAFEQARGARRDAGLEVATAAEGLDWFDLTCALRTEDGRELPWELVSKAVEVGRECVVLPDGTLARIPPDVRRTLTMLTDSLEGQTGGRLRFHLYQAPAVSGLLGSWARTIQGRWRAVAERLSRPPAAEAECFSPALASTLREYQKEGVAWLRVLDETGLHGILADEMGLGKTAQALALLAWRKRTGLTRGPSLVICPTSLVENWRNEAQKFVPELSVLIIQGAQRAEAFADFDKVDLAITSYALLRRDIRLYHGHRLDYVILDEAQHIKNPDTANALYCKELQAGHRLILTGTPVENGPMDIWSLFDFLLPGLLGPREAFQRKHKPATGVADRTGSEILAARIHPFILRRRKSEVCRQLPPKIEQVLYCEMDAAQARLYATFLGAGRQMLRKAQTDGWHGRRFQVLALLMRLRQVCCHPQLLPAELLPPELAGTASAKTELLQEMILESIDSGHRILLFSQFTAFLRVLKPWLEREGIPYEYLDGSTTDRQARVDRFNGDASIPLFLMSLRAGGTGLNLTGADTVIHYDQWWNPMVEDQATDRTHRIGQTRQVTAVKLVVRHSVEEKILVLQERKRHLFQALIGGAPTKPGELTAKDIEFLFADEDATLA